MFGHLTALCMKGLRRWKLPKYLKMNIDTFEVSDFLIKFKKLLSHFD